MGPRSEEDPDEEPEQPSRPDAPHGVGTGIVPSVAMPNREWEYSTKVLTVAQVADGVTLVKLLHEEGLEGWELGDVIDGGDKRVILMRRAKRTTRESSRRVGFAPPTQN